MGVLATIFPLIYRDESPHKTAQHPRCYQADDKRSGFPDYSLSHLILDNN
jgi:hypothetical protein